MKKSYKKGFTLVGLLFGFGLSASKKVYEETYDLSLTQTPF